MERIYYDGACGFCHARVRSVIARDPEGRLFRFAPLGGTTFPTRVPEDRRRALGDTLVVETEDGRLLLRSDAVIHILRRVGRGNAATFVALFPRPIRDLGYRLFASVRRLFSARPPEACPAVAPELRARFDP